MVVAFLETIRRNGRTPTLYTYLDFYLERLNGESLQKFGLWIADYNKRKPRLSVATDIWQYSDDGKIPGISERVDLDLAYTHY